MFNHFKNSSTRQTLAWLTLLLFIVLAILFSRGFEAGQTHFANDGPLGVQKSPPYSLPSAFFGIWNNLFWLGGFGGNYFPNFTGMMLFLLGPIGFHKFCVPLSALILGLSAAFFFRQLGFKSWVCIVGGMAAGLNSNFLSNACWGLPTRPLSLAAIFLALAAVQSSFANRPLIKTVLAGIAIGLSISEGGDNGAIFSIFVAGFAFVLMMLQPGPAPVKAAKGVGRVALMATLAAIVALQSLNVFVQTAFKGMSNIQQESKERRWDWATQWSLPKLETLRVVVPGLFGYRIDEEAPTPPGGEYWGTVGRQPGWEKSHQGFPRHSGAGEYAGVLVVLVAIWAVTEALRREGKVFGPREQKLIWFWSAAGVVALLLSWGRYAPFYQFVYALPYLSTIRNPMKFMHPLHMVLMILFAYGLEGLGRRYLEVVQSGVAGKNAAKAAAPQIGDFERKWTWGCVAAVGVAVLGWMAYSLSERGLVNYLTENAFNAEQAALIAKFSIGEVGLFVFFLALSAGLLIAIVRGVFAGPNAKWAMIGLGLLVVIDLGRANTPWIKYYNYEQKYASNAVIDVLRQQPYEHRVAVIPGPMRVTRELSIMGSVYDVEWLQQQFPYYNIQALDIPQEPRMPAEKEAYLTKLMNPVTNIVRLWELTNTRFLCGMGAGYVEAMNQQLDPAKQRFRLHTAFDFKQGPNNTILVQTNQAGPYALIEFTGALPRAQLCSHWQVNTNDQETLKTLASGTFDPRQTVLVSDAIAAPPAGSSNQPSGKVEIVGYAPKRVKLHAQAGAPSVLLLNDKFDLGWQATLDGKPVPVLRCNFLMRGVQVPAGEHTVEFTFRPQRTGLYFSMAGLGLGLLLCGVLVIQRPKSKDQSPVKNP